MGDDGWNASAKAWIADMGETGDYGRQWVLDGPMIARLRRLTPGRALDVGCGEGRFCRILRQEGFDPVGLDPTVALLEAARARDPRGLYVEGRGEALDFPDASFGLVVSCLSLIDIEHADRAIAEMARVLRPGGHLLIANLTSFSTAANPNPWRPLADGTEGWVIDHYMDERSYWIGWGQLRVLNWHRPLSTYMSLLLDAGLELRHFDEPMPRGGSAAELDSSGLAASRRVPGFVVMDWQKAN